MKFAYRLEETDRDEHGNWWPKLCWADGMISESQGRIEGSETFESARLRVGRWNWNHGISGQDAEDIIFSCYQRIATLTERSELWNS
jgi:hypothetical protein